MAYTKRVTFRCDVCGTRRDTGKTYIDDARNAEVVSGWMNAPGIDVCDECLENW